MGLIGCGNIGMHLVGKLREHGTTLLALESNAARRAEVAALGVEMFAPEQKDEFLRRPMDAVVVNAAGGSLDPRAVALIGANERLQGGVRLGESRDARPRRRRARRCAPRARRTRPRSWAG